MGVEAFMGSLSAGRPDLVVVDGSLAGAKDVVRALKRSKENMKQRLLRDSRPLRYSYRKKLTTMKMTSSILTELEPVKAFVQTWNGD